MRFLNGRVGGRNFFLCFPGCPGFQMTDDFPFSVFSCFFAVFFGVPWSSMIFYGVRFSTSFQWACLVFLILYCLLKFCFDFLKFQQ